MDCIFCNIAQKKVPASIVYEDKDVIAFLSINPINEGHTLVIPKNHVDNFYDLNEKDYSNVMGVVKEMSKKINKVYNPKKVGVIIAGFDVAHTHVHVIPMHDYHDITSKKMLENKLPTMSKKQLDIVGKKISGVKL